jgi:hypothetical protein
MIAQIQEWSVIEDRRAIFLRCYAIMTRNMQQAVAEGRFHDPVWMGYLVEHFAGYYFLALEAYEREAATAPVVWQRTFDLARDPQTSVIHNLLFGVNAHINYDLVLAIGDLLGPEAAELTPPQLILRRADHDLVNDILAASIDTVQEQVVDEYLPGMRVVDLALGPLDEHVVAQLIVRWRDGVWSNVLELVCATSEDEREAVRRRVEQETLALLDKLHTGSLNIGLLDALLRWLE